MVPFPWVLLFISCTLALPSGAFWVYGLLPLNRQRIENGRKDFLMDAEHFAGGKPQPHKLEVRPKSKAERFYIAHTAARMVFMCISPFMFIALALLFYI